MNKKALTIPVKITEQSFKSNTKNNIESINPKASILIYAELIITNGQINNKAGKEIFTDLLPVKNVLNIPAASMLINENILAVKIVGENILKKIPREKM